MRIEQKLCQVKITPIDVECNKMYRSKGSIQEFTYFVSGLDIKLEQSENDSPVMNPVRKKIGCRWRNTMSHILFLGQLIQIYGLVVEVSHSELGDMCSIPDEC